MYHHSGFVVPFLKHRQSKFSIILKGPSIFGIVDEPWVQLQVAPAVLTPDKRVNLSFEALKPGIDFSSLAMKFPDDTFFQYTVILSTLKICSLA